MGDKGHRGPTGVMLTQTFILTSKHKFGHAKKLANNHNRTGMGTILSSF